MSVPNLTEGACRKPGVHPDLFFPIGKEGPALRQIEAAKQVCRRCPVIEDCLRWALETRQPHGVLGGMSEDERRAHWRLQSDRRRRSRAA